MLSTTPMLILIELMLVLSLKDNHKYCSCTMQFNKISVSHGTYMRLGSASESVEDCLSARYLHEEIYI